MKRFQVGIVGCGAIFPMHAHSVAAVAEVEIAAVCDIRRERAERQAAKFGGRVYTDFAKMIDEASLDAVHICTPHYLHAPMAVYALEHGINVLVEKPMAIHFSDAQRMAAAQQVRGAALDVIFQNRFNTVSQKILQTLKDGKLGQVVCARAMVAWNRPDSYYSGSDWKGTWDKEGGGVLINQAIHTLDLMRFLIGSEVTAVEASLAQRKNTVIEVEDTAEGMVTFQNGAYGLFYATNCNACDSPVELILQCERGFIAMKGSAADITYENGRYVHLEPDTDAFLSYGDGIKDYWGFSHYIQISRFYDSLLGRAERIDLQEALKTQQMLCAIYQSGRQRKRVAL